MTLTADHPARANSEGEPCPSWCITDHAQFTFHGSERISFRATDFSSYHARVVRFVTGDQVAVSGAEIAYVPADRAPDLAGLIEGLAGATPEEHRKLAAAIRQAAAAITETSGA